MSKSKSYDGTNYGFIYLIYVILWLMHKRYFIAIIIIFYLFYC